MAKAGNPEGFGPLLPLAFASWDDAVSHEAELALARQRLADLEASVFFLSISRALATDDFIELRWVPTSAELLGFLPHPLGEAPIRTWQKIDDLYERLEHFDERPDSTIAKRLTFELDAIFKLNNSLDQASDRFQLHASACFSEEISSLSAGVTLRRASAIDLARLCGFERVAALMEAESLRPHAASALPSKPAPSL